MLNLSRMRVATLSLFLDIKIAINFNGKDFCRICIGYFLGNWGYSNCSNVALISPLKFAETITDFSLVFKFWGIGIKSVSDYLCRRKRILQLGFVAGFDCGAQTR